jgi:tRNA A37 N6-isopentenylltransferase MiaA
MPGSHYYLQRDSAGNTHKGASNFIERATAELELKEGMKEEYVRNLLNSMFGRMLPSSPKTREKQQAKLVTTEPVAQTVVKVDPVRLEEIEQANELQGKVEEIASEYGLDLATISDTDRQACIQLASYALKATPEVIKRVSAREFFGGSN